MFNHVSSPTKAHKFATLHRSGDGCTACIRRAGRPHPIAALQEAAGGSKSLRGP